MAKSKLSEDELAWILTIDATEAQQELRKVNRESKELSKTNKELVNKMNDLIAAGKKESEEYRNLSKEVKANNAALALNRERVQALEGQIGTTALTMNQLRKQAKELQRQLDNTSKATNPDEYKRLETRLNGVREQMSELRNNGKETGNALSSSFMKVSTAVKGFAALKVVQWLKDLTVSAFNTRSEFARYETVLTQTLQSQEAAADAMRMLKDLANDTPYALSELTDAYVKMVNRGITPSREELIKLGDLSSSLGKSLDQLIEALLDAQTGEFERLKEFGIKASKENDKVTFSFKGVQTQVQFNEQAIADYIYSLGELQGVQGGMVAQMDQLGGKLSNLSDAWDNLLNNLGKKLEPFFKWVLDSSTSVVNAIGGLFTSSSETYRQQFDKVAELDRTLPNLIATYESLANKTNRSAEENKRLKETVDALAKAVPSSVNGWHKLTGAIDINISKVHEYIEAEKKRLQFMNQDRIKEVEKQVKKYEKKLDEIREKLNKKGEYQIVGKSSLTLFAEYSNDVLGQLQKDEEKYEQLLTGANEELKRLNGTSLQDQLNTQNEKLQKQQEFNQMTKQQLAEYIQTNKNAADQYVELAQSIYDTRFPDRPPGNKSTDKKDDDDKKSNSSPIEELRKQDAAKLELLRNSYEQEYAIIEAAETEKQSILAKSYAEGKITQEQYEMAKLSLDANSADQRLAVARQYLKDVTDIELKIGLDRADAVKEANEEVMEADLDAAQARAAQQDKLKNLVKDFKDDFNLVTPKDELDMQLKALEASYQARKEMAEKEGMDTLELTELYEQAKNGIMQKYEEQREAILDKYLTKSYKEEYNDAVEELNKAYQEGLISYEEFMDGVMDEKIEFYKKVFDDFASSLSNAVSAMQDAELASIDAKYDAEIQRAAGNTEEVARLEEKKEREKLAVQRKYAGIEFAIKVSEIIANTAVAIMQAYAKLGPIAGGIAAAMLTATGLVQIAAANAEREKVMNMTASSSSGTSSSNTGKRVVTGLEEGGTMPVTRAQDGKNFNAVFQPGKRGYVNRPTVIVGDGPVGRSREWVASNDALRNPTVAPFINVLNEAQSKGIIRTVDMNQLMRRRLAGFQSGGFLGAPATVVQSAASRPVAMDSGSASDVMGRLYSLLSRIETKGVRSYVVYSDIEKTKQTLDNAKKIGAK